MASISIIMRRCMEIGKKEASIADLLACYIFDGTVNSFAQISSDILAEV